MAFVTDASIAAAWLLPDEEAALAETALDRLADETACVPDLFWHELRNLLLSAERRGRIDRVHADASMARIRRLPSALRASPKTIAFSHWRVVMVLPPTTRATSHSPFRNIVHWPPSTAD